MNLSRADFSVTEEKLFEKGFSHNIRPVKDTKVFELLGIEIEIALRVVVNSYLKYQASF